MEDHHFQGLHMGDRMAAMFTEHLMRAHHLLWMMKFNFHSDSGGGFDMDVWVWKRGSENLRSPSETRKALGLNPYVLALTLSSVPPMRHLPASSFLRPLCGASEGGAGHE